MSFDNQAAWLAKVGARFEVQKADVGQPGSGELLIKNHAVAINPVDAIMQDQGMFVENWPVIVGEDLAGEVAAVGPDVKGFQVGQRVLAHPLGLATKKNTENAFQNYTLVQAAATSPIPDNVSFEAASALPLSLSTAAHGLYGKDFLKLPYPSNKPHKTGETILIWGGSSSVGAAAIQLAKGSGLEVITTASKHNFDFVKGLGPDEVFDYSNPGIVGDIVSYVKDKKFVGALDGKLP